jgi:hypothetical protein
MMWVLTAILLQNIAVRTHIIVSNLKIGPDSTR